jgi:hypothetical protein
MTTTCQAMLERMLEADLDDLNGHGDAAVATHVRECERCRAVADRLTGDTAALGRSIRALRRAPEPAVVSSRSAIARLAPTVALIAAAASVVFIVLRSVHSRSSGNSSVVASVARTPAEPPPTGEVVQSPIVRSLGTARETERTVPARQSGRDPHRRGMPRAIAVHEPARAISAVAVTVAPTVMAAAPRVVPVVPVLLDTRPRDALGTVVTVEPPAGTRAEIIRTNRPGVTVVWLH